MNLLSTNQNGFWDLLFDPMSYTPDPEGGLWLIGALSALAVLCLSGLFAWIARRTTAEKTLNVFAPTQDFRSNMACAAVALGAGIVAMTAGTLIGVALTGYQPKGDGSISHQPEEFHLMRIIVSLFLTASPLAFLYASRLQRHHTDNRPFAIGAGGKRLLWIPVLFVAWFALHVGTQWLARTLQLGFDLNQETQVVLAQLTTDSRWRVLAAILTAIVAAPISEEFAFRAGLMGGLRKHMGFIPASVITTLLFVVVHSPMSQPQFIAPIATLGFALCWVYETSRNIWFPIALHALHNGLTLVLVLL